MAMGARNLALPHDYTIKYDINYCICIEKHFLMVSFFIKSSSSTWIILLVKDDSKKRL
jgi:hypothetical protein